MKQARRALSLALLPGWGSMLALFPVVPLAAQDGAGPTDRAAGADAVVVGRVEDSRTIVHRKTGSALFYVRLKAKVEAVEKGRELVRGAEFIDIRCWREGAAGHHPMPADGAGFRAFLKREDEGFWTPLEPDGFELAEGAAARAFPVVERRRSVFGFVLGGLFGLAVLCAAAVARYRGRTPRDRTWGEGEG
jgi:hypothetical protein